VRDFSAFLEKNAVRGWKTLEDFRGLSRGRIVAQSRIARPGAADYHGGHDAAEGYADPAEAHVGAK